MTDICDKYCTSSCHDDECEHHQRQDVSAHPAEAAAVTAVLRPEADPHDVAQRRGKELGEWRREYVPEQSHEHVFDRCGCHVTGDEGPYMDPNGPGVWVPRTVPYLRARQIAKEAIENYGDRIAYLGKTDAILLGFTRDCLCEEDCAATYEDSGEDPNTCRVPAWAFELGEP